MRCQGRLREEGISDTTYHQWKSNYGGMEAAGIHRLLELEADRRLKRLYADPVARESCAKR
jgi:hypothetical protein